MVTQQQLFWRAINGGGDNAIPLKGATAEDMRASAPGTLFVKQREAKF
jgi:hypothetical protein